MLVDASLGIVQMNRKALHFLRLGVLPHSVEALKMPGTHAADRHRDEDNEGLSVVRALGDYNNGGDLL